jgi:hypothetical protein
LQACRMLGLSQWNCSDGLYEMDEELYT